MPRDSDLHVMIFQDQKPSRVFQVSERWFTLLGWTVLFLLLVAIGSALYALRSYQAQKQMEREQQLIQLSLHEPPRPVTIAPVAPPPPPPVAETTTTPSVSIQSQLPAVDVTPQAPGSPAHLKVTQASVSWQNGKASIRFNLEYTDKSGSQQGRIILLARGRGRFIAYPAGVLSTEAPFSLHPENGEYFSVSRLRVTKAEIAGFPSRNDFEAVDVFIYDQQGSIIFQTVLKPANSAPVAAPASGTQP